jgi:hypothetical protein
VQFLLHVGGPTTRDCLEPAVTNGRLLPSDRLVETLTSEIDGSCFFLFTPLTRFVVSDEVVSLYDPQTCWMRFLSYTAASTMAHFAALCRNCLLILGDETVLAT